MTKLLLLALALLGAQDALGAPRIGGGAASSGGATPGQDFNGDDIVAKTLTSTGTAPSLTATGAVFKGSVTVLGTTPRIMASTLDIGVGGDYAGAIAANQVFFGNNNSSIAGADASNGQLLVGYTGGFGIGEGGGLLFQSRYNSTDMATTGRLFCGRESASSGNISSFCKMQTRLAGAMVTGLYMDSAQKVGIGTEAPAAKLHISSGASNTGTMLQLDGGSNLPIAVYSTNSYRNIFSVTSQKMIDLGTPAAAVTQSPGVICGFNDVDAASRGKCSYRMAYANDYQWGLWLDGTELRTLRIGNAAVHGTASAMGNTGDPAKLGFWLGDGSVQNHYMDNGVFGINTGTTRAGAALEVKNGSYLANYAVKVSSQDGTTMTAITAAGNLGIGTASPAAKLHISSGTIWVDGNVTPAMKGGASGLATLRLDDSVGAQMCYNGVCSTQGGGGLSVSGTFGVGSTIGVDTDFFGLKILTGRKFSMGDATPDARFEILADAADDYLVMVSSKDDASKMFAIDKFGHYSSSAAVNASLGTCTNGTLVQPSNDRAGKITFSGANTSCAIAFANAYPTAGNLICTDSTKMATPAAMSTTVTTTGITFVATAFASGDVINYLCEFVGM